MQKKAGIVRVALFVVLTAGLSACVTQYRNHGYIPPEEDVKSVTVGRDSKDTVLTAFGPPAVKGQGNDNSWYYVQSQFEHYAYREPVETQREVMAVSFSSSDKVSNIERFGLEDGQVVVLSRRVTPVTGRDNTFLRQLLGNVGSAPLADLTGGP